MNKILRYTCLIVVCLFTAATFAQEGKCGDKVNWSFDGMKLSITYVGNDPRGADMYDYDMKSNLAPWIKKGLSKKIKKVSIGTGINRVGSCAFYNCAKVNNVEFEDFQLKSIGWGAFFGCSSLLNIYLPRETSKIERIAFANCSKLSAVEIPEGCAVEDQAFMSCSKISNIIVPQSAHLGAYVFVSELTMADKKCFALYGGHIQSLPLSINEGNCKKFGLSEQSVAAYLKERGIEKGNTGNTHEMEKFVGQSDVDTDIPAATTHRNNTFALIIGNEQYSKLHPVPCALSDARAFREYCVTALGIPSQNVTLTENATLNQMRHDMNHLRQQVSVRQQSDDNVNVIVYYAGHGVPDEKTHDSYLMPVDGFASDVTTGMSLQKFYSSLGDMMASNVTVFIDACFSGAQRDGEMVSEGLRGVAIKPTTTSLSNNMVVFSAAQGDETAQPYVEKGHGMFTYYLLKKIQEDGDDVSYGKLADYVRKNVSETTVSRGKIQTPSTSSSPDLENRWKHLKF